MRRPLVIATAALAVVLAAASFAPRRALVTEETVSYLAEPVTLFGSSSGGSVQIFWSEPSPAEALRWLFLGSIAPSQGGGVTRSATAFGKLDPLRGAPLLSVAASMGTNASAVRSEHLTFHSALFAPGQQATWVPQGPATTAGSQSALSHACDLAPTGTGCGLAWIAPGQPSIQFGIFEPGLANSLEPPRRVGVAPSDPSGLLVLGHHQVSGTYLVLYTEVVSGQRALRAHEQTASATSVLTLSPSGIDPVPRGVRPHFAGAPGMGTAAFWLVAWIRNGALEWGRAHAGSLVATGNPPLLASGALHSPSVHRVAEGFHVLVATSAGWRRFRFDTSGNPTGTSEVISTAATFAYAATPSLTLEAPLEGFYRAQLSTSAGRLDAGFLAATASRQAVVGAVPSRSTGGVRVAFTETTLDPTRQVLGIAQITADGTSVNVQRIPAEQAATPRYFGYSLAEHPSSGRVMVAAAAGKDGAIELQPWLFGEGVPVLGPVAPSAAVWPAAVVVDNRFAVVFARPDGALVLRLIDAAGALVEERAIGGSAARTDPFITVLGAAVQGSTLLVTWNAQRGGEDEILAMRVPLGGGPSSPPESLGTSPRTSPSVVAAEDRFVSSWFSPATSGGSELVLANLEVAGAPPTTRRTGHFTTFPTYVRLSSGGDAGVVAAWLEARPDGGGFQAVVAQAHPLTLDLGAVARYPEPSFDPAAAVLPGQPAAVVAFVAPGARGPYSAGFSTLPLQEFDDLGRRLTRRPSPYAWGCAALPSGAPLLAAALAVAGWAARARRRRPAAEPQSPR